MYYKILKECFKSNVWLVSSDKYWSAIIVKIIKGTTIAINYV